MDINLTMKNKHKLRVIFISANNSMHSQVAAALLRLKNIDSIDVFNADIGISTIPSSEFDCKEIESNTLQVMKSFGLESTKFNSPSITKYSEQHFDYVILLNKAITASDIDNLSASQQLVWHISNYQSKTELSSFITLFEQLNSRINMLLKCNEKSAAILAKGEEIEQVDPISFYKCLTDEIRLKTIILTHYYGELCVCDLMYALQEESQPKVSRNLAVLKKSKILSTRKQGQWVFYRVNEQLPLWIKSVIAKTAENNMTQVIEPLQRLEEMKQEPNKNNACQ